jgi:CheY-like chemotaxis protein
MNPQLSAGALSGAGADWADLRPGVLVVDDEPLVLAAVCEMLARSGYRVTPTRSAEEAVGEMHFRPFDLVLSDYRLGGRSGDFVALAARQSTPPIPVVIMTGLIEELPGWLRGGDRSVPVIRKPFRLAELLQVLRCATTAVEDAAQVSG